MGEFFERLINDPLGQITINQWIAVALSYFYAFTLVVARMAGLMAIGPVFGQATVPMNVRVLLVLSLSLLVTPGVAPTTGGEATGYRLQATVEGRTEDGRLRAEDGGIENSLARASGLDTQSQISNLKSSISNQHDVRTGGTGSASADGSAVPADEGSHAGASGSNPQSAIRNPQSAIPQTLFQYAWSALGEFSLGFVLGLGVLTVLSGLQLAGELIDQQMGTGLASAVNPMFEQNTSITGQALLVLGTVLLLCLEPINGHLQMVGALVESFHTFPVGHAFVDSSTVDLLRDLVHQSLVLAVQVAAPLLAMMALVSLTLGYLGRAVPQMNVFVVGFPVRAIACVCVLALSLSGAARTVVDSLPRAIEQLRAAIT